MTFDDMTTLLGKGLGIELATEGGTCGFAVEDKEGSAPLEVILTAAEARSEVLIFAELGDLPPEGRPELFRALLEANNLFSGTAGATIGIDPATGRVRLQRHDDADAFANDAVRRVGDFVETALAWRRLVADFRARGEAAAPDDAPAAGDAPGGFLAV